MDTNIKVFRVDRRHLEQPDAILGEEIEVVKKSDIKEVEEENERLRYERAPEVAQALFDLIQKNDDPPPQGRSFFASAIYELAVAYGEQKHGHRNAEARIEKALGLIDEGRWSDAVACLTKKE